MSSTALEERRLAAEAAAEMVDRGMRLGLGTGRTAELFVAAVGKRVAAGLELADVVCTSLATERAAQEANLTLCDMMGPDAPHAIDLAVDGADEIDDRLRLIKGGGASLLREKIVAQMATTFVVVGDSQKRVTRLGAFPLPIEVVPFGWRATAVMIEKALGVLPQLRMEGGAAKVTDNGNYIVDCALGTIADPDRVAAHLAKLPGVVEHGLFLSEADLALVAKDETVSRLERRK
ncbi:MAG: ribose-5-phosphate isomerase RpiA [Pseudomonadota bacterium]